MRLGTWRSGMHLRSKIALSCPFDVLLAVRQWWAPVMHQDRGREAARRDRKRRGGGGRSCDSSQIQIQRPKPSNARNTWLGSTPYDVGRDTVWVFVVRYQLGGWTYTVVSKNQIWITLETRIMKATSMPALVWKLPIPT